MTETEETVGDVPILEDQAALPLIYRDAIDNIRDLKQRQWRIAYYGLAIIAALFGVTSVKHWNPEYQEWPKWAVVIIGLLVVGFGGWTLGKAQQSMGRHRQIMREIIGHFAGESQRIARLGREEENEQRRDIEFPVMLLIFLVLGAGGLYWWVFRGDGSHVFYATMVAAVIGVVAFFAALRAEKPPSPESPSGPEPQ